MLADVYVKARLPFSVGSLIRCMSLLPEFKNSILYIGDKKEKISGVLPHTTFNALFNWQRDYLNKGPNSKTEADAIDLAKKITLIFLKLKFFCQNKMNIANYFFNDLNDLIDFNRIQIINYENKTIFVDRSWLAYLIRWPSFEVEWKIGNDKNDSFFSSDYLELSNTEEWQSKWWFANDEQEDAWKIIYYCLYRLIRDSLLVNNAFYQSEKFYENRKETLENIIKCSQVYGDVNCEVRINEIYGVTEAKKNSAPKDDPNTLRFDAFVRLFNPNQIIHNYEFIIRTIRPGANAQVGFIEMYSTDTTGLKESNINIRIIPSTHSSRSSPIDYIKSHRTDLWLERRMFDLVGEKYLPYSYPKVHLDSAYQTNVDPGDESKKLWTFIISAIEFYDHLIYRSYFNNKLPQTNPTQVKLEKDLYFNVASFKSEGFRETAAFFLMAGEGTWVISSDGYVMVSVRFDSLTEMKGACGYSSAGSLEYTSRLNKEFVPSGLEANPFITAQRELWEEVHIPLEKGSDLELISFGIEPARYLQQFSFLHMSSLTAEQILNASVDAESKEQGLFALKLNDENINRLIDRVVMEPGAIVSLKKIITILKNREQQT
ncbi:hypothetical protein SDC9_63113 [bioreactor metagenome]|uniref:Nudix hydrolase domain-containing protein n=1 Tax=bioreactor metagenome TaxID=1076179 RepID=A0A644XKL9_9ZZZZ